MDKNENVDEMIKNINENIEKLSNYTLSKKHQLLQNFLFGIARGFGISIGIVVLGAIVMVILKDLVTVPVIGKYIAEIMNMVEIYTK